MSSSSSTTTTRPGTITSVLKIPPRAAPPACGAPPQRQVRPGLHRGRVTPAKRLSSRRHLQRVQDMDHAPAPASAGIRMHLRALGATLGATHEEACKMIVSAATRFFRARGHGATRRRFAAAILLAICALGWPGPHGMGAHIAFSASPRTAPTLLAVTQNGPVLALRGGYVRYWTRNKLFPSVTSLAPSPNGRQVAIVDGSVWLVDQNGTHLRKFLSPPRSPCRNATGISAVAWSPAGDTMAFIVSLVSDAVFGCPPGISDVAGTWVAHVHGTPAPHQVSGAHGALSWSANGRFLLSAGRIRGDASGPRADTPVVRVVDITSRASRILVQGAPLQPGIAFYPMARFAPVTGSLAYTTASRRRGGPVGIWVAGAEGRHAHRVARAQQPVSLLSWSPDGRTLAYMTGAAYSQSPSATRSLWVVGAARRGPTRLVYTRGPILSLAWAPNGRRLAYIGGSFVCYCRPYGYVAGTEVYTVDVRTRASHRVTTAGGPPETPPHPRLFTVLAWPRPVPVNSPALADLLAGHMPGAGRRSASAAATGSDAVPRQNGAALLRQSTAAMQRNLHQMHGTGLVEYRSCCPRLSASARLTGDCARDNTSFALRFSESGSTIENQKVVS